MPGKELRQQPADADFGYRGRVCTLLLCSKGTQRVLTRSLAAVLRMNCSGTKVTADGLAGGIKAL